MRIQAFYRLTIFLFFFGYFPEQASAQILNVEKSRLDQDTSKRYFINAAFSFRANNRTADVSDPIRFLSFNSNLDLAYLSKQHSYMLLNFLDYLSINEDPFISFGYTHGRINFLREKRISYELFAQGQYDLLRGLDQRYLAGAGIRIKIVDKSWYSLYAGLGIMYEHEKWDDPQVEGREVSTDIFKSANYLSARLELTDYLDFNFICYYQGGKDNVFNRFRNRFNSDANLSVHVNKTISLRTSFVWAFDSAPIVPITKFIYAISNGIQFNLGTKRN